MSSDRGEVAKMQKGHGDWVEDMIEVCIYMYNVYVYYLYIHTYMIKTKILEQSNTNQIPRQQRKFLPRVGFEPMTFSILYRSCTMACCSSAILCLCLHTVSGSAREGGEGAAIRGCAGGSEGQEVGLQSLLPPASTGRTISTGGQ